ncbi:HAD-IIB family hydrolase [Pseudohalioglobus lutimaris]|uniref:Mannosyl-3-phosphoglycerate phosphatase n=1 Tax=Pseudohalioglobus lutimaris TaxID=1737061 RepID=A0A2N5X7H9_9GAMM|nr:HAD-IIB family hydrolase [Pseudohalioglobus lutimaris]PLW70440.1 mannosyl-3-phosphoglycerate phosphatase [Pseudohalioglobus lutimaris]
MSAPVPRLVFTDLDGSLLDHQSYSFAPATPLLAELAAACIPVVPVTSKTRVEIEALRQQLDNTHPFIVENGAAVFIPQGYFEQAPHGTEEVDGYWVKAMSGPRQRWLDLLDKLRPQFEGEFENFYRAGPAGIAAMTGLSPEGAVLANQREYSEPVQWRGADDRKAAFVQALTLQGAHALQGGRFLTIAGDCDKGRALDWLRTEYRRAWQASAVMDIAVGDSGNDVAMLDAAGSALLVRSPVHDFPELKRDSGVMRSAGYGPEGWVEGVGQWLAAEDPHKHFKG